MFMLLAIESQIGPSDCTASPSNKSLNVCTLLLTF